jgi:Spherulation-specific family 4
VSTVTEESFTQWQSQAVQQRLSMVPYDYARSAYMVHSVPVDDVRGLVRQLRHRGKYLFVTDLSEHYYVQFGSSWREFIDAMHNE